MTVTSHRPFSVLAASLASVFLTHTSVHAQTLGPEFSSNYSIFEPGVPTGVPQPLGGLTVDPSDTNYLLIGGSANAAGGVIHRIRLRRNQCDEIIGFEGSSVFHSNAPYIDGGLVVTPDGVTLSSRYPLNGVNMTRPGSTTPDRVVDLSPLGVAASTGSIAIVPAGFPGAGRFKIAVFNSSFFTTRRSCLMVLEHTTSPKSLRQRSSLAGLKESHTCRWAHPAFLSHLCSFPSTATA